MEKFITSRIGVIGFKDLFPGIEGMTGIEERHGKDFLICDLYDADKKPLTRILKTIYMLMKYNMDHPGEVMYSPELCQKYYLKDKDAYVDTSKLGGEPEYLIRANQTVDIDIQYFEELIAFVNDMLEMLQDEHLKAINIRKTISTTSHYLHPTPFYSINTIYEFDNKINRNFYYHTKNLFDFINLNFANVISLQFKKGVENE